MVVAYVSASVTVAPGTPAARTSFYINTGTLQTCLKTATGTQTLEISRYPGANEFVLYMKEPRPSRASTHFRISTLPETPDPLCLQEMEFDYTVASEMGVMRSVVKTAKDLGADFVRMRVIEYADTKPSFVLSFDGEASVERVLDTVDRADGPVGPAGTDPTVTFDQEFSTNYLHVFLKALDKTTVAIRLAQNLPLLMTYSMGEPNSSMNFILDKRSSQPGK
jgi:hypothetical protein